MDERERTLRDVYDSMNEEQKTFLHQWVGERIEHPFDDYVESPSDEERRILSSLNGEQKEFCYLMVYCAKREAAEKSKEGILNVFE